MEYLKKVLVTNKNYKVTHYINNNKVKKLIIAFGEIDSDLDDPGYGAKIVMENGFDYIYVAQKKGTQYQFLSSEKFVSLVSDAIKDKEVYTYGSSLGGYCAIYYGGAINANILAMSPRIPAHPVINKLMGERFRNSGFYHQDLKKQTKSSKNVSIFYDKNNYIDNYFVEFFLKVSYPRAHYQHIQYAGHYTARALLLSNELKKVAINFFNNKMSSIVLNEEKILEWHFKAATDRVRKGYLSHAQENIEVLLTSTKSRMKAVRDIIELYNSKLIERETVAKKKVINLYKNYPIISDDELDRVENAVSISFVGDLIVLRDQVLNSYNSKTNSYEFDSMFTYVKKYLNECDFNIGVFEGPTAGENIEYTTSNYRDGIPMYLNYPDSFAVAVKQAGFDLVSTASNHFLDHGVNGAMRTLDVLDEVGLNHVGSYRNIKEKTELPIFNIKGLRVAVLAYTMRNNRYSKEFFLKNENKHLTSLLVSPDDKNFETVKKDVQNDFMRVKEANPDCIIVITHIGQDFLHEPDNVQKAWCDIFVDEGADIILNDHPHAVQPYEWRKNPKSESYVLILHCPGNFVSSYTEKDGDASALTQIFIDQNTGKPFALACVPLWSYSLLDGNYTSLPVYEIVKEEKIRKNISVYEFKRIEEVHELVTEVMLGEKLTIDQIQEKYYLFADRNSNDTKGYVRNRVKPLYITEYMKEKAIYNCLLEVNNVCFVGDSVTEGTINGGYGWYEPLIENFRHLSVKLFAKGGATSEYFLSNAEELSNLHAELYIMAFGMNDIRYRDAKKCAMNANDYVNNISEMVDIILAKNPLARFVFVAPWTTYNHDPVSKLDKNQRLKMLRDYSDELEKFARINDHIYIDANLWIEKNFSTKDPKKYLKDFAHPNADEGIVLYSRAVLEY